MSSLCRAAAPWSSQRVRKDPAGHGEPGQDSEWDRGMAMPVQAMQDSKPRFSCAALVSSVATGFVHTAD